MSGAGSLASWILARGGSVNKKVGTAMSIKANRGSLALIMFIGLWKRLEMG